MSMIELNPPSEENKERTGNELEVGQTVDYTSCDNTPSILAWAVMLLVGGDVGASASEFNSAERIHCKLCRCSWKLGKRDRGVDLVWRSQWTMIKGFYMISVDIVEAVILIVFC